MDYNKSNVIILYKISINYVTNENIVFVTDNHMSFYIFLLSIILNDVFNIRVTRVMLRIFQVNLS